MPTFILFQNGNKVSEVVGAIPQKLEVRHLPFSFPLLALCAVADCCGHLQELVKQGQSLVSA